MEHISTTNNSHLSFLKARDPSILSGNKALTRENVRTNLVRDKLQESSIITPEENNIQIYLRIKNAENIENLYRIEKNEIYCSIPNALPGSKTAKEVESVTKKYTFSHIFNPDSLQEEVFNLVVKPKIFKFINGDNSTLMSYGASGSGKTFTIVGTSSQPGIIPRTLEYLFRTLPDLPAAPLIKPTQSGDVEILNKLSSEKEITIRNVLLNLAHDTIDRQHTNTYQEMQRRLSTEPAAILDDLTNVILGVWVSFAEIYNEHIYDLLTSTHHLKTNTRPKLQLASFSENTYIKNLTNVSISSGIEAYQIFQYGLHNLNYASTSINSHSSRSHCVFTIKIAQNVKGTNASHLNYFNICDLAGSERVKKTLNVGDRLKESNNINTSLLVLGRCITCIRESQKKNVNRLIPFRDSKLTRLFQRALSGYESISMIVNMNPSLDMFDENQHVLNFSAIAKNIVVKHTPAKRKNRFSVYLTSQNIPSSHIKTDDTEIAKLKDIIDKLHIELKERDYFIQKEQEIRAEIVNAYQDIINNIRRHEKEMNEARRREYLHDNVTPNNEDQANDIIIIDSSSDEEISEETKNANPKPEELEVYKLEINASNIELAKNPNTKEQCSEVDQLKKILVENSDIIRSKDNEINELKKTLEDAKIEFLEAQESINELLAEFMELKETNSELNVQIDEYSKILDKEKEEI